MSNMNIYKVIKIGILLSIIIAGLNSILPKVLGENSSIESVIVSVLGLISFGWTIFKLFKMWSIRNINTGFNQFAIFGLVSNIAGMFLSLFAIILIAFIGLSALGLDSGAGDMLSYDRALEQLGSATLVISLLVFLVFIATAILNYKSYTGLYLGTEQILDSNAETIGETGKVSILENMPKIKSVTKRLYFFYPIIGTVIILLISLFFTLKIASALILILAILLFVLIIVTAIELITFYFRLIKLCVAAEQVLSDNKYWN